MRKYVLILLLFCAALSWAQESSVDSGSTDQDRMPQPTELSSLPTSLLWQIGSDALQSSLDSLQTQNGTLTEAQSLQPDLTSLSLEMLASSQRQEAKMNALSLNFGWLSQSMTSFVSTTTQAMEQMQKQVNRQNTEIWFWRGTTLLTAAVAVYLAIR